MTPRQRLEQVDDQRRKEIKQRYTAQLVTLTDKYRRQKRALEVKYSAEEAEIDYDYTEAVKVLEYTTQEVESGAE